MSFTSVLGPEFFITRLPSNIQSKVTSSNLPTHLIHKLHDKEVSLEAEVDAFIESKVEEFSKFAESLFAPNKSSKDISQQIDDENEESMLKLQRVISPMVSSYEPSSFNQVPLKSSLKSPSTPSASQTTDQDSTSQSLSEPTANNGFTSSSPTDSPPPTPKPSTPKKKVMFSNNDQVAIVPSLSETESASTSPNPLFSSISEIFGHGKGEPYTSSGSSSRSKVDHALSSPLSYLSPEFSPSSPASSSFKHGNPTLSAADEDVISHNGFFYSQEDPEDEDEDEDIYTDYSLPSAPVPNFNDNYNDEDNFTMGANPPEEVLNALQSMAEKSEQSDDMTNSSLESTEEISVDVISPPTVNHEIKESSIPEIDKQAEKIKEDAIKKTLPQMLTAPPMTSHTESNMLAEARDDSMNSPDAITSFHETREQKSDFDADSEEEDDDGDDDSQIFEFDEALESKASKSVQKSASLNNSSSISKKYVNNTIGSLQHKYFFNYKNTLSDDESDDQDSNKVTSAFSSSLPIQIVKPQTWTAGFHTKDQKTKKSNLTQGIQSGTVNNVQTESSIKTNQDIDNPLLNEDIAMYASPSSAAHVFPQKGMDPASMSFSQRLTLERWGNRTNA